jgi:hypothetical protein
MIIVNNVMFKSVKNLFTIEDSFTPMIIRPMITHVIIKAIKSGYGPMPGTFIGK